MPDFTCYLARAGEVESPRRDAIRFAGRSLEQIFRQASSNDVRISLDDRWLAQPQLAGQSMVNALDLHETLAVVTGNSTHVDRVTSIAVIFAPRYLPKPEVFGVMFDRGTRTDDDPSPEPEFMRVPREGCAVFVDALSDSRREDFKDELAYTVIHEVGHVFNLQHETDATFMAEGLKLSTIEDLSSIEFSTDDKDELRRCFDDGTVHPGGSPFGGTANRTPNGLSLRSPPMHISIPFSEIHPCDPVELDLSVRGLDPSLQLLDRFDPGYQEFNIWIRTPSGAVRTYRSNNKYCSFSRNLVVEKQGVFRRDISIFRDAAGHTFSLPGEYTVWATYDDSYISMRSNEIELEVAAKEPRDSVMLTGWFSDLCFYRHRFPSPEQIELLNGVDWREHGSARTIVDYSLARAQSPGSPRRERLRRLVDQEELGEHRRNKCKQLLVE